MTKSEKQKLADEMLHFLRSSSLPQDLTWTLDLDYLLHFEAERHLIVSEMLAKAGFAKERKIRVLDFGYLHGLTQEFLHRAFPQAEITVCDLPSSPIFSDSKYLATIKSRNYLRLVARNICDVEEEFGKYDVIFLGEIIEHFDPTTVASILEKFKRFVDPDGVMIVTTPNASGLYNCYMTLRQKAPVQVAPIPSKTFGYGHIHLWSPSILQETASHFGWSQIGLRFYHGREAEQFARAKKRGISLKARIVLSFFNSLTYNNPTWRGFFVAAFVPNTNPG